MLLILESGPHSVDSSSSESYSLWLPDSVLQPSNSILGFPPHSTCPNSYCLKSSHSRSLPSRFLCSWTSCSSLSILNLISLKFFCPRTPYSPHLSPPDVHFPLLYPRYLRDRGLPHLFGGFTVQKTSPAAQAHAQPYLHIVEWEERLRLLSSLQPPRCPQPPFFPRWCYSWSPTGNGLPLSDGFTPFLEGTSYCFVRGLPVQIGAMGGGEGSHPYPPQGVTWDLNKGLTSHLGSETH